MQPRRYLVRGTAIVGTEVSRHGDEVKLDTKPAHWPFPRSPQLYPRAALVLVAGNEPPEPEREPYVPDPDH